METIKITNSKNTKTTRYLVGKDCGYYCARPAIEYREDIIGPAVIELDVVHEAMFPGTSAEWLVSLCQRVEDALEAHRGERPEYFEGGE